ncbi:carbonic anhydrase [Desulfobacterota bacterium AH_259_B03_O07]|nr:carbonic anhydrase [Desulfobacterota bacterium AH_259_B03_O07]
MSKNSSFSRRKFIQIAGLSTLGAGFLDLGDGLLSITKVAASTTNPVINGEEALKKLMEGNRTYVQGLKTGELRRTEERRREVAPGQNPFAVILACADSRVAPEIIFNQGIGDLFVVRVAGNIVNPTNYGILGSIEFGVKALGAPLIMVLGHDSCGAVAGAIQALETGVKFPGSIQNIVTTIQPAVVKAKNQPGDLLHNSIISNVKLGVNKFNNSQPIIANMVKEGKVKVVGGNYDLKTGVVEIVA